MVSDDVVQRVLADAASAKEENFKTFSLMERLATYFHPQRRGFTAEIQDGTELDEDLFTSIPQLARRGLSTAISAMLRPPGRDWFRAHARNEQLNLVPAVRRWLDVVTRITIAALYDPRARMEKALSEADNDIVTFGHAAVHFEINERDGHFIFSTVHPKHVHFRRNFKGFIDSAYRYYPIKLRNMPAMFGGIKNLSAEVQDKLRQDKPKFDEVIEVLHAVAPNEDFERLGLGFERLPYRSLWIETKTRHVVKDKGYYDFCYIVPTWEQASERLLAYSPAMIGLSDARVADAITASLLDAAEKAANPPLTAPADLIRGDVELIPGGVTLYDAQGFQYQGSPVQPVELGKNLPIPKEMLEAINQRIYSAFFRDILELPNASQGEFTAAEINARVDQFLRQAAPTFARLEVDYNAQILNRAFSGLMREGAFPPPPDELRGQMIEFEYESPLKTARERAKAMKNVEAVSMIMPYAEAIPEVAENIDWDEFTRRTFGGLGGEEAVLMDPAVMAQKRQERIAAQRAAQIASIAKDAAPALSAANQAAQQSQGQDALNGQALPLPAPPSLPGMY